MVATSAHECASAYVCPPSGSAPSGLPRFARLDPGSLRKPKFRCAPFSLTSLRLPHIRSAKCHLVPRCHRSLPLAWSWLFPLVPRSNSPRQAALPLRVYLSSFGRILPRSSVELASLRSAQSASFLGTIAFALVILKFFPLSPLEIAGRTLFF